MPSFVEAAELNAKIAADEIKIALGSSNDAPVLGLEIRWDTCRPA